jgi:biopolymer transport protein ExbD
MRFRDRQSQQIPFVNLVPMMDVLMTVLTFFIIISMSLTGQQLQNVTLPSSLSVKDAEEEPTQRSKLEVGLDKEGKIVLSDELAGIEDLKFEVLEYLVKNPTGTIVLKADRGLAYEQVAKLLEQLNTIGGGRVSLVVERN